MAKFPPRTKESDQQAKLAVQALDNSPNSGQNFMVTAVTTIDGNAFIAISGSNRRNAEAELKEKLHWIGQLNTSGKQNKQLRRNIRALKTNPNLNVMDSAHKSATAFSPLRDKMIDPNKAHGAANAQLNHNFLFQGNRDCSEPKALQAAAESGKKITGMTTVWYGAGLNSYPHPDGNKFNIPGNYARPCNFCMMNELRIMQNVQNARANQRGVQHNASSFDWM